jgi:hypothetical protein
MSSCISNPSSDQSKALIFPDEITIFSHRSKQIHHCLTCQSQKNQGRRETCWRPFLLLERCPLAQWP